ncbi:hypothetical protein BAMBUS_00130 [Brevundimonas phage vB_BpoS-Bambus]|nr:hypothetical protein BAMBUS_00130 [Brevundimonas phage vB_BpoS-Bambus]
MSDPTTVNFIVGLQIEGGAFSVDHVKRALEFAIQHYREAEGLTADDDDGSVTEFMVSPDFLTLSLAQGGDPLTTALARYADDIASGSTLEHYAAEAAFRVLASNWADNGAVCLSDVDEVVSLLQVHAASVSELPTAVAITAHEACRLLEEAEKLTQMSEEADGAYAGALTAAASAAVSGAKEAMTACLAAIIAARPGTDPEHFAAQALRGGMATPTLLKSILKTARETHQIGAVDLNDLKPV